MIENKNDASRNLEKALQALEQAKQRVGNKKKKRMSRNAKTRTTTGTSWAEKSRKTKNQIEVFRFKCLCYKEQFSS